MIVAHFTRPLEGGPFVNAVFHISEPRLHALLEAGLDLPSPVQGRALIDRPTGRARGAAEAQAVWPLDESVVVPSLFADTHA